MKLRTAVTVLSLCIGGAALRADFSYQESTKMTGGAVAGVMKVVGVFSRQARQPMVSSHYLKGDRMAQISADRGTIIDLGKETITQIDFEKKTYSVLTFAEMRELYQKMMQRGGEQPAPEGSEAKISVSSKETGQSRQIGGLNAREVVTTIEMESTDPKTGQKGKMTIVTHSWLAPDVPGYGEVRNFQRRMAEKMIAAMGMNPAAMAQPGFLKGMQIVSRETAKLDGVAVLEVVRFGGAGEGMTAGESGAAPAAEQQAQRPGVGEAAAGAVLGRFGLGRRKRAEEPKAAAPQQEQAQGAAASPGALMETTTERSGFSSAPVAASRFEVPAGFREVESEMKKALR